jgi:hypothetical protein
LNAPTNDWSRKDFEQAIHTLVSRCDALEIAIKDLELDCAQYRLALSRVQTAIFEALTKNPFPWNPDEQKVWDEAVKANKMVRVTQALKPGRKLPPPDWHKERSLPH